MRTYRVWIAAFVLVGCSHDPEVTPDARIVVVDAPVPTIRFAPQVSYWAGAGPMGIAVADLDGDRRLDLSVANNFAPDGISTLLNLGDGTFEEPVFYPEPAISPRDVPSDVYAVDLNGDGRLDLIDNDNVRLNAGDGTFGAARPHGGRGLSIALGDVDGNGVLDLAGTMADRVTLVLGQRGGSFGAPRSIATGPGAYPLALGDLDGDGKLDLAVGLCSVGDSCATSKTEVLLGHGDGTFGAPREVPAVSGPLALALGDLDGDGKLDLVVGSRFERRLVVLLGHGDGTFALPVAYATDGDSLLGLAIGDLDADGRPDLVVSQFTAGAIGVFLGTGGGTFAPMASFATGNRPRGIAITDIDRDGHLDLVVSNQFGRNVSVLLQLP